LQNEKSSPLELLFIGDAFTDYLAARENNAQFLGIVVNQSENPFPKDIPVERDLTCLTEVIGEIKSSQP
jgi:phosphoglycolate phosphatase-like HAD superfamily hydrolase